MNKCPGHKEPILLYKSPVKVWAGGKTPNTPIPIGSTVLDLVGGLKSPILGLDALESRIVRIDWPDMGIPAIDAEGWRKIVKAIVNLRKPIFMACGAGHGRTGTALVIFGCLSGQIPKKMDPIFWVRDRYCPNAVEAKGQVEYIERITGRTTTAKPSGGSWTGQDWPKFDEKGKGKGTGYPTASQYPLTHLKDDSLGPVAREKDEYPTEGRGLNHRTASETYRHFGGTRSMRSIDDPELDPSSPRNRL